MGVAEAQRPREVGQSSAGPSGPLERLHVLDRPFAARRPAGGALEVRRRGLPDDGGQEGAADFVGFHEGLADGRELAFHGGVRVVPGYPGTGALRVEGDRHGGLGAAPILLAEVRGKRSHPGDGRLSGGGILRDRQREAAGRGQERKARGGNEPHGFAPRADCPIPTARKDARHARHSTNPKATAVDETQHQLRSGDFTEADEPWLLFSDWMEEAKRSEPGDPNAMALATVDASGVPNVRMVLLKAAGPEGLVFYTNTE